MNEFILMGRLTKDPERKSGSKPVVRYTLAVKDIKDVDFLNCVVFGKEAEFAENYLRKGTMILVRGRIKINNYEKNGQKIYVTDLVVDHQEFCESKKE